MPTSKSTHQTIAGELGDAALDNLHTTQREGRLSAPAPGAAIGGQRESSPHGKPSARREEAKAGKLVGPRKRMAALTKTRSPKRNASRHKVASKAEAIITLLKRSQGANIAEMMKATRWQAHSVRGFLSATVKRRMGLSLLSERADGKERRYRIV